MTSLRQNRYSSQWLRNSFFFLTFDSAKVIFVPNQFLNSILILVFIKVIVNILGDKLQTTCCFCLCRTPSHGLFVGSVYDKKCSSIPSYRNCVVEMSHFWEESCTARQNTLIQEDGKTQKMSQKFRESWSLELKTRFTPTILWCQSIITFHENVKTKHICNFFIL